MTIKYDKAAKELEKATALREFEVALRKAYAVGNQDTVINAVYRDVINEIDP